MNLNFPPRNTVLLLCLLVSSSLAANSIDAVNGELLKSHLHSAAVQQKIDDLHQLSDASDREYRALVLQLDSVNSYNQQLQQRLLQQREALQDIEKQLLSVDEIKREISPLMAQMQRSLIEFVAADLPFLAAQRQADLQQLDRDLQDLDLADSGKYQKILQAYLREESYSHSMQTYQAKLETSGRSIQVNYLLLGRVALYYQHLDGTKSALWSRQEQRWVALEDSANDELGRAIKMATNGAAAELLNFTLALEDSGASDELGRAIKMKAGGAAAELLNFTLSEVTAQ